MNVREITRQKRIDQRAADPGAYWRNRARKGRQLPIRPPDGEDIHEHVETVAQQAAKRMRTGKACAWHRRGVMPKAGPSPSRKPNPRHTTARTRQRRQARRARRGF